MKLFSIQRQTIQIPRYDGYRFFENGSFQERHSEWRFVMVWATFWGYRTQLLFSYGLQPRYIDEELPISSAFDGVRGLIQPSYQTVRRGWTVTKLRRTPHYPASRHNSKSGGAQRGGW